MLSQIMNVLLFCCCADNVSEQRQPLSPPGSPMVRYDVKPVNLSVDSQYLTESDPLGEHISVRSFQDRLLQEDAVQPLKRFTIQQIIDWKYQVRQTMCNKQVLFDEWLYNGYEIIDDCITKEIESKVGRIDPHQTIEKWRGAVVKPCFSDPVIRRWNQERYGRVFGFLMGIGAQD